MAIDMVPQACPAGRPRRVPSLPDEVHLPDIQRLFWGGFRAQTGLGGHGGVWISRCSLMARRPSPHRISLRLPARLLRLPLKGGVILRPTNRERNITPPYVGEGESARGRSPQSSRRRPALCLGGCRRPEVAGRAGKRGAERRSPCAPRRSPCASRARPRRSPCAARARPGGAQRARPRRSPCAARARPVRAP